MDRGGRFFVAAFAGKDFSLESSARPLPAKTFRLNRAPGLCRQRIFAWIKRLVFAGKDFLLGSSARPLPAKTFCSDQAPRPLPAKTFCLDQALGLCRQRLFAWIKRSAFAGKA
jgi:hypothetical protein